MKPVAAHFGGTRNGLVISWPKRLKDKGGMRSQFHHVIDIVPTILEAAGIPEPRMVNGVPQKPIEGVSMVYTWDDAKAEGRRTTQYFEMFGNRAVYHNGWVAACQHGRLPWQTAGSFTFENDTWELYNIENDFSESNDLARKQPEKLRELQDIFMAEAAKYNVLPLDDRMAERLDTTLRPGFFTGRKHVTFYPGMTRLPEGSGPKLVGVPFTLTAPIEIPQGGAEGVIFALGGDAAGWSLFLWKGKPRFHYNFFGIKRYDVVGPKALTPGKHTIKIGFSPVNGHAGGPAVVALAVDGKLVGK